MRKKVSLYWWCQIVGWAAFILLATFFYFNVPSLTDFPNYYSIVITGMLGLLTSHLMRLFIVKTGLLNLKISKQFITMFLTDILFSFIYLGFQMAMEPFYARPDYTPKFSYGEELLTSVFLNAQFLGVWNLIYFFYHHIQRSQREEIERIRLENELKIQQLKTENTTLQFQRDIADASLTALRSQMNPHFIFNSLNSIQKFIWDNKQEDAAEYLNKFSRLMRMILDNSMQKWITLEQELNTLMLYVEMEHRRSNNKFDYTMKVDNTLDTAGILVPPMIMQPYIENAIWHGLLPKDGRGNLYISIMQGSKEDIECVIEDNGIGRSANGNGTVKNESKRISYGMQLTRQRIIMSELNGQHGDVVIEDLKYENNIARGTRVTIHLPLNSFIKI